MARTKQAPTSGSSSGKGGKLPRKMPQSAKHLGGKPVHMGGLKKKKHRYRPGTVALREIRKFQRSTEILTKKAPFRRVLDQICMEEGGLTEQFRLQSDIIPLLQEAAQSHLIQVMEDANLCTIHAKRITVKPIDVQLARRVRHEIS